MYVVDDLKAKLEILKKRAWFYGPLKLLFGMEMTLLSLHFRPCIHEYKRFYEYFLILTCYRMVN